MTSSARAADLKFPVIEPAEAINLTKKNLKLLIGDATQPLAVEECIYTYRGTHTWYANFGWPDEKQTGLKAEAGPDGPAVRFTTGYAVANVLETGLNGSEWTISVWVRPDERDYTAYAKMNGGEGYFPTSSTILSFQGETVDDKPFSLRWLRLRPEVKIGDWVGWTDQRLPLGRWSLVTVTRDSKGTHIFVNGKPSKWLQPLRVDQETGIDLPGSTDPLPPPPAVDRSAQKLYVGGTLSKNKGEDFVKIADKLIGAVSGLQITAKAMSPEEIEQRWIKGREAAEKLSRLVPTLGNPLDGAVGRRPDKVGETPQEYRRRMKWFSDARFGMFIHWGMSSITKGDISWSRGKESGKTPPEVYDNLYKEFDPQDYDPNKWAEQIKASGFKYGVLTTKHHDGFCLWPTDTTKYNISAAPYGKDLVGHYVEAMRKAGLGVGFYFSWPDWPFQEQNEPKGMDPLVARKNRDTWNIAQLKELATRYGTIDLFWFDAGGVFKDITPLQPNAVVNDRVYRPKSPGGTDVVPYNSGDYYTPENAVADFPYINPDGTDTPWEMCSAMSGSWGYSDDIPNETPVVIVRRLSRAAGMGGNWLLNVAPRRDGKLPKGPMHVLARVGDYLRENAEAFYGTHRTRLGQQEFGFATASDSALYLHIHSWPARGVIEVEDVQGAPSSVRLLQGTTPLKFSYAENILRIEVPQNQPDSLLPIIKVEMKSGK